MGRSTELGNDETRGAVIGFPLSRQHGRIRATAKLLASLSDLDIADNCRHAIAADLFSELAALGHDEDAQDEAVGIFFCEVELEMLRIEWAAEIAPADALEG
jgi:hypothetical protein